MDATLVEYGGKSHHLGAFQPASEARGVTFSVDQVVYPVPLPEAISGGIFHPRKTTEAAAPSHAKNLMKIGMYTDRRVI